YYAAIDAVVGPNGQVTCRINLPGETEFFGEANLGQVFSGPPVTFQPGQCIPLNIFGNNAPSQEALDWVLADHSDSAKLKQYVLSGSVSGDTGNFFNLPGGPIGFALGAEYRKEKSSYTPSELSIQGQVLDNAEISTASGKFDDKEPYAGINL